MTELGNKEPFIGLNILSSRRVTLVKLVFFQKGGGEETKLFFEFPKMPILEENAESLNKFHRLAFIVFSKVTRILKN